MQPSCANAGSSTSAIWATVGIGMRAISPGAQPALARATNRPSPSSSASRTFSKPSASLMPSQTADSVSSADARPLSWADTRRRCSTPALWRALSACAWALSTATAMWAAIALSTSRSSS